MSEEVCTVSLSPRMKAAVHEFFKPFEQQLDCIIDSIPKLAAVHPIAICALYGSMLTGVSPWSDVNILILIKDSCSEELEFMRVMEDIREYIEAHLCTAVPVTLRIQNVSSFMDTAQETEFKRNFSENNAILWDDMTSVNRKFIEKLEKSD